MKEIIALWGDGLVKECNVFLLPWQDKINIDRGTQGGHRAKVATVAK